jgi:hypothetical protein
VCKCSCSWSQRRKKVYPEEEEDRYKAKRIDGLTQCQFRCLSPHAVIVFQYVFLEDLASHCLDGTRDLVFGRKSEKSAGAREENPGIYQFQIAGASGVRLQRSSLSMQTVGLISVHIMASSLADVIFVDMTRHDSLGVYSSQTH